MMVKLIQTIVLGCLLAAIMSSCKGHSRMAVADVYGKCPQCGTMVGGFPTFWDGQDDKGNPVSGTYFSGNCESCKSILEADGDSTGTNVVASDKHEMSSQPQPAVYRR
jgi:hypothetical protein